MEPGSLMHALTAWVSFDEPDGPGVVRVPVEQNGHTCLCVLPPGQWWHIVADHEQGG